MSSEMMHDEDERLTVNRDDVRSARRNASSRADREATGRRDSRLDQEQSREVTARRSLQIEILPTPPALPGFHLCWLSTTNQYDPIFQRARLGYVPVEAAELPGFDPSLNMKTGEYAGKIMCNEMLLCKIPEGRYRAIMRELHHDAPDEEEGRIRANVDHLEEELKRQKVELVRDKGFERDSSARRRAPQHWD